MPAIVECFAVSLLFLTKFKQWRLTVVALSGVVVYGVVTVKLTQWRKKFR